MEEEDENKIEQSEFTPPPKDDRPVKIPKWDRWKWIMAIGMGGLSLIIWIATVIVKP